MIPPSFFMSFCMVCRCHARMLRVLRNICNSRNDVANSKYHTPTNLRLLRAHWNFGNSYTSGTHGVADPKSWHGFYKP